MSEEYEKLSLTEAVQRENNRDSLIKKLKDGTLKSEGRFLELSTDPYQQTAGMFEPLSQEFWFDAEDENNQIHVGNNSVQFGDPHHYVIKDIRVLYEKEINEIAATTKCSKLELKQQRTHSHIQIIGEKTLELKAKKSNRSLALRVWESFENEVDSNENIAEINNQKITLIDENGKLRTMVRARFNNIVSEFNTGKKTPDHHG